MVIRAKRFRKPVGVGAIQEVLAAKGYCGCSAAMVVTNSRFTRPAKTLAQANGVTLWDRNQLVEALLSVQASLAPISVPSAPGPLARNLTASPFPAISAPIPEPVTATPAATVGSGSGCVVCGKSVSEKARAYCAERPERFDGRTLCYDHQRASRGQSAKG